LRQKQATRVEIDKIYILGWICTIDGQYMGSPVPVLCFFTAPSETPAFIATLDKLSGIGERMYISISRLACTSVREKAVRACIII
jgi:hypothetical protein